MAPRAAFIGVASGFASTLSAAGAPVSRAALAPALAFPLALGVGGSSMEQKSQNHPCGARRSANSHSQKCQRQSSPLLSLSLWAAHPPGCGKHRTATQRNKNKALP